jgi:membrane protein implicated in regulation of membrane protease activity
MAAAWSKARTRVRARRQAEAGWCVKGFAIKAFNFLKIPKTSAIKPSVYFRYIGLGAIELVVVVLVLVVVQRWLAISEWLFWSLIVGWIAKDAVLFPFVWRAYDQDAPSAAGSMIGARGIAKDRLDPSGYVQVRGELWKAEREGDGSPIERGCSVRIRRMEGLTLYVSPDDDERLQIDPEGKHDTS